MTVVLSTRAVTSEEKQKVNTLLAAQGCVYQWCGPLAVIYDGNFSDTLYTELNQETSILSIQKLSSPYPLVSREFKAEATKIKMGSCIFGDAMIPVIAGPCSVETPEQMIEIAAAVANAGCSLLRGGAFKPRTSPYSFQGLGEEGLTLLKQSAAQVNLPVVTELMDIRKLDAFLKQDIDIIQIGSRNMQNFELLRAVGQTNKPIILKRGLAATIKEWLLAAEYIAASGNEQIILCERGLRHFDNTYRNLLDLTAIPYLKTTTHLPVIVDPSHAAGKAELVPALAMAAVAAGADGLLIECHPNPSKALSDGEQSLTPAQLSTLIEQLRPVAKAVNRVI